MATVWVITKLTIHEASRKKVLLFAFLLGLLYLGVYAAGLGMTYQEFTSQMSGRDTFVIVQREVQSFFLMMGLYGAYFLSSVLAILTSVDTISGEVASGAMQTLAAKPVRRWQIFLGKWLGFVVIISVYMLFMLGGVTLTSYLTSGYTPPNPLAGFGLIWLTAILLLNVSLLGGTFLSTLTNGVLVFGLYGVAFIGGWVEQFGAFLKSTVAINVGIFTSLILPSEAIWKRAMFEMKSPLGDLAGGLTPFSAISVPSTAMIVYALLYGVVVLLVAMRNFEKADL